MFKRLCSNWLYIVLGPLALTAPLTSFLRFSDISFLSPGAFFSFAVLILIGLIAGLVMALGGNLMQALMGSGIVVLLFFSEIDLSLLYPQGIQHRYVLLLAVLLISIILHLLREHRVQFLLVVFGTWWLVGAVSPKKDITQVSEQSHHQPDESLPPYIHIILNGHIGIEGIPPSFNKNNKLSLKLKKKYIDQDFLVFGRSYSRFAKTALSFASFLNFQSNDNPELNWVRVESGAGFRPTPPAKDSLGVRPNALFQTLGNRGYIVNVFSPMVLPLLCDDRATTRFGKCIIHGNGLKLFSHDKFKILHTFANQLRLLAMYARIASAFGWPEVNVAGHTLFYQSVASSNEFIDFLGEGKRGNAYFIHLLVSHPVYVLDEKCSYKKNDLNFFQKESTDETYARYIKQIQCAHVVVNKIINKLNSNPETQDSTIIIHGDHGPPIPSRVEAVDFFSSEEYFHLFSTFFAIRSPSLSPGYDKRPFALDELLKVFSLKEPNLLELENKKEKFVYAQKLGTAADRSPGSTRFTLPPFANGIKVQSW